MSRATVVYLLMIAALVGGLWGVLALGATLTAPEDFNGRWVAADGVPSNWRGLTVEQSGRYFELAFDGSPKGLAVSATLVGHPTDGPVTLARGPWSITIDAANAVDGPRTFHVDGPVTGTFTGRREASATTRPAAR